MSGTSAIIATLTTLFKELTQTYNETTLIPILHQIGHQFSERSNSFNFILTKSLRPRTEGLWEPFICHLNLP